MLGDIIINGDYMFRIGVSTSCYHGLLPTEDALVKICGMGVKDIEVFLETASEYKLAFVKKLRSAADDYGAKVNSVHPMGLQFEPQLFYGSTRQRKDSMDVYKRVLEAAFIIGAQVYVMHGPALLKKSLTGMDAERFGYSFAQLAELARSCSIRLTLENVHWCFFNSPSFGAQLNEVNGIDMSYTLDIKQALLSGHSIDAYLDVMAGRLYNVHVCDLLGDKPVLPGKGNIDFKSLMQRLTKLKYIGLVVLEVYASNAVNENDISDTYRFLQDAAASI